MRLLGERLVTAFTSMAASEGWRVDFIEEDDFASYFRPHSGALVAEIGFDLTPREWGLSLNPSVSVRMPQASELQARLFGFDDGDGGSQVGTTLSTLVRKAGDEFRTWTVKSVDEVEPVAHQVLSDVAAYGAPFYRQYSSLDAIIGHLQQTATIDLELGHLVTALVVAGRTNEASEVVDRMELTAQEGPELVASQTMRFVTAFRERFSISS
jgi:hypothetical protein